MCARVQHTRRTSESSPSDRSCWSHWSSTHLGSIAHFDVQKPRPPRPLRMLAFFGGCLSFIWGNCQRTKLKNKANMRWPFECKVLALRFSKCLQLSLQNWVDKINTSDRYWLIDCWINNIDNERWVWQTLCSSFLFVWFWLFDVDLSCNLQLTVVKRWNVHALTP